MIEYSADPRQLSVRAVADLDRIAAAVEKYYSDDPTWRAAAAQNAMRLVAFEQQTVTDQAVVVPLFPGTGYRAGSTSYSLLVLYTDQAAGKGRLLYGATQNPTAAGYGIPLPSGGGVTPIVGAENIRGVKVIAETGQTFVASFALFA